jgi:hypothetical protein
VPPVPVRTGGFFFRTGIFFAGLRVVAGFRGPAFRAGFATATAA